jgi:hypothetical protein
MKIRIPNRNFKKIEARRELVVCLSTVISLATNSKKDIYYEGGDDTRWHLDEAKNWIVIFYPDEEGVVDIVYKHNVDFEDRPEDCLVKFIKHQLNATEVIESSEPHLPGASIHFTNAGCCGSHENGYGVGEFSLAMHRPGQKYVWVDLGHIYYSNPTPSQLEDARTSPSFTAGSNSVSNIHRRLSRKQAQLLASRISQMINTEFSKGIPSDDEIQL